MIAYKGFHADLTCTFGRGQYQYQPGIWIEEKQANCGRNGMHCAENPLECLSYYGNWERSAYYQVEVEGDVDETGRNSHISATRMKLVKKLDKIDFVAAAVEYICRYPAEEIQERTNGWLCVAKDRGQAPDGGAVIVYGEKPMAKGPAGSVIALVKTGPGGILGYGIQTAGTEKCKANTWYGI